MRPSSRTPLVLAFLVLCTAAAPALAASAALAHLDAGAIRLGYRIGTPPFSFKERDQVRGYSVELCERAMAAIAAARHVAAPKIEWVAVDASTRLDAVASGRVDAVCGTTTITLSRRERVDFSVPIYVDGGSLLVRADASPVPARLADMNGKRIAVIGGTTTEAALTKGLALAKAQATLVHVKDGAEGVAELAAKRVDGYAGDRIVLTELRQRSDAAKLLTFLAQDFSYEPYGIVVRRDDPDFRLALDRALVGIYKSGEIDGIFATWFGDLGRPGALLNAMFYLNMLPE
jgi:polar amino acid transport system substrate-binding protein/glutamate/aspartate transport system substrate-binding protein